VTGLEKLNGQWFGAYSGNSTGSIIVNIDETQSNYRAVAYLVGDDKTLPGSGAGFQTLGKNSWFKTRTEWLISFDPHSGQPISLKEREERYPEISFPAFADVDGSVEDNCLRLSWRTDVGTTGSCVLPRSKADQPSELSVSEESWDSYKRRVALELPKGYLFRGQNRPWRLRTSFHRSGRADLQWYIDHDIPALHRQLSARTRHIFNLTVGDENGAFFNLVQRHGYPTPLLDWTYSPYVAAFFAYRSITNEAASKAAQTDKARILVFDQERWKRDLPQLAQVICPTFHVSMREFIAIENERMIPQQASSMITNVDDIESYIRSAESEDKKYLWAIDLPVSERRHVIHELSYMGITAGSLFPGLDGACEELKERNFEI
jgi:hypothetical protein